MKGSFGGTHGAAANPGGQDVAARGKDVDKVAVVGVRGAGISRGGSADSADGGLRSRGVVGSVGAVVAGSDTEEDVVADERGSSAVDSSRVATAQRHVGNDTLGAVAVAGVGGDVVDAGDDARVRAGAAVIEDLDTVDGGLLGDTVGAAADGAGNVSAVAVAVSGLAADEASDLGSTATELLEDVSGELKLYCWGLLQGGWPRHRCR